VTERRSSLYSILELSDKESFLIALTPFSHVYAVTATVHGKPAVTSRWQDTLEEVTIGGQKVYRRTQISTQSNGRVRTWISVFLPESLSPVADTFNTSEGDIFIRTFANGVATDYSSNGAQRGVMTTSRAPLPSGYSDFNGGQFGLALLQLPLALHYKATLTTFAPTDSAIQLVPIEVLRTEKLAIGSCSLDAFVVRATFAAKYYPDEGQNSMTFWLTRGPPYVAKLVTEAPEKGIDVAFNLNPSEIEC
jgi:hypothetical protein